MRLLTILIVITFSLLPLTEFGSAMGQQSGGLRIALSKTPRSRATQNPAVTTPTQPFPALNAAAQAQLQTLLNNWEQQSKGMKTLECSFTHSFRYVRCTTGTICFASDGVIKYAAPDKGLFRVDQIVFSVALTQINSQSFNLNLGSSVNTGFVMVSS